MQCILVRGSIKLECVTRLNALWCIAWKVLGPLLKGNPGTAGGPVWVREQPGSVPVVLRHPQLRKCDCLWVEVGTSEDSVRCAF